MARQQASRRGGSARRGNSSRNASRSAASGRRQDGVWAASAWREFTGRVHALSDQWRAFTDHIPFTDRGHAHRAQGQRLHREWAEAEPEWSDGREGDGWGDDEADGGYGAGGLSEEWPAAVWPGDYPGASKGKQPHGAKRKLPAVMLVMLVLICVLIGFVGTQGVLLGLDIYSAATDAKAQATALEALAKGGELTQASTLAELRQRLDAVDADLARLQSDIPFQGQLGNTATGGELLNVLRMATLLVQAGEYGLDAGQVLIPAIKGMMSGLGDTAGTTATALASAAPPLTIDDLQRVTFDVDSAGLLVQQATRLRAQVTDASLRSVGLGAVAPILDKLDSIAPKLPEYLYDVHYAASALPALVGLAGPANYLLFSQDSDELRPTGGFLGNYAVLTFAKGKMTSGVHLKDIYTLDCPHGGYQGGAGCYPQQIPDRFAWLSDDPFHFGVRDSNLDPDFPNSAGYIEQSYKNEAHQQVQGVIAFTPAFIGKILDVLGGLEMPSYGVKVTAANLQDTIHYYHILYAYCGNSAYWDSPLCKGHTTTGGAQGKDRKTFDAELGSTLMKIVATASTKLQGKVLTAVLGAISSRDLQIYFNDAQVEGLLGLFHADNTMPAVQGDQLMVVDANVGASYADADLQEQIADTITLSADGSATHNLSITYTYPYVKHSYSAIYSPASSTATSRTFMWYYQGTLLLMTPPTSQPLSQSNNCHYPSVLHPPEEPGRNVWACADEPIGANFYTGGIDLRCNTCTFDGTLNQFGTTTTLTVRFSWVVPAAVKTAKGAHAYHIGVVHQAGSHPAVTLTIVGPSGKKLTSAVGNPALKAQNGGLTFTTAKLLADQDITVSYK